MYESPLALLAEYRRPSPDQLDGPTPSESCRDEDDEDDGPAGAQAASGSEFAFHRADSTEARIVSCVYVAGIASTVCWTGSGGCQGSGAGIGGPGSPGWYGVETGASWEATRGACGSYGVECAGCRGSSWTTSAVRTSADSGRRAPSPGGTWEGAADRPPRGSCSSRAWAGQPYPPSPGCICVEAGA